MSGYPLTPEHETLRLDVARFAEDVVRPLIPEMEKSKKANLKLAHLIAKQGWIGVRIGGEYGGMGLGHVARIIVIEELSRVSGAAGAIAQASMLGVAKILHFGNDEQKSRWLPRIAAGDCLPTIAVTESGSGSHVGGIQSTAVRDGDEWVLNGGKVFIGNNNCGDLHGVVVRTGPSEFSAFLVEGDRPGLTVEPQEPALGLHGFSFGELTFTDCRVPAANMIGAEGEGKKVADSSSVVEGRTNLAAVAFGIHRATVEDTAEFANTQIRYGEPLAAMPTVKQDVGLLQSNLMAAQATLYLAGVMLDRGLECDAELHNAKYVGAERLLDSVRIAMGVHGALALFPGRARIERYLRDAHHIVAPAATSHVQLHRLSDFAIGTNRPAWSERFATSTSSDH